MTTRPLTSPSLSSLRLVIMLPLIPLLRPSSCRLASSFLCLSSPILRPKASGSEGEEHTRRKKGDECETNRSEPGDKKIGDRRSRKEPRKLPAYASSSYRFCQSSRLCSLVPRVLFSSLYPPFSR